MHRQSTLYTSWLAAILMILVAFVPAVSAAEADSSLAAEMLVDPSAVSFETSSFYQLLALTVGGPDGEITRQYVEGAAAVYFDGVDDEGVQRPDGRYTYELRGVEKPEGAAILLDSGTFTIAGGSFASPDVAEDGYNKDQVIAESLIVNGSQCLGLDCVDGEEFVFDTLKLKENNTRILFQDTSNVGEFATRDWMLRANDSTNGGAESFSIIDCDNTGSLCETAAGRLANAASVPFTIEAGAPTNSLYVDSQGDVGIGTGVPAWNLHIVDGNTPTVRLDQDGSEGFTSQLWDIAGNEFSFFIRDTTNNSALPFRIRAGAPEDTLYLNANGNVGLGTDSPDAKLDVDGSIVLTGTVNGRDLIVDGSMLDGHITDFNNPHQVTAEQVGAISQATLDAHVNDFNNPHQVTAEQVGAISQAALDAHVTDFNNPHQVTAEQVGAASQSALDGHVADFNNPHQVTAAQTGAATQSALDGHVADFNNPHQVTAAQVGADPAGTAAAAVAALEASLNDGLPVPVAEGGTGATDAATARANLGIEEDQSQTGIVSAAAFQGSPATASVTFASPYAVGTTYAVLLTAISSDPSNLVTANVIALDETGFTVAVSDTASLSAVSWMVRPAVVASAVAITSPADGSSFMPSESFDVDYVLASAVGVNAYLDGVPQANQFGGGPITLTAPATEGTFELRLEALDANGVELGVSDAIQIEVAAQTSAISCTVVNPNVWNNGYVLNYTVTNEGSETIDAWSVALQFTEQANFGNSWNAQLTLSSDGTVIEASNASYNGTLAPGQSASFGFQGSHDGTFDVPTCSGN